MRLIFVIQTHDKYEDGPIAVAFTSHTDAVEWKRIFDDCAERKAWKEQMAHSGLSNTWIGCEIHRIELRGDL